MLVLALGRLDVEVRLGVLEALAARVQLAGVLARQVEDVCEDEPGIRRAELGDELPAAVREKRLEQLARELAHRRLHRRHALGGEHGIQRPPVARMLRRVEVQRRPPARDGVLRHDDPLRAREVGRPRARGDDVVVAGERPEVPAGTARDRAGRPQPRPGRVGVGDEVLGERIEVGRRRAHRVAQSGSGRHAQRPPLGPAGHRHLAVELDRRGSREQLLERDLEHQRRERRAGAAMRPGAEGEMAADVRAVEHELVRVGEHRLVAVGRRVDEGDRLVLADRAPADLDVSRRRAREAAVRA